MAHYAILNFEDKIDGTGVGAADSTIKALKYRYEDKRAPKGIKKIFVKGNKVNEHRCVEKDPVGFTTDMGRLGIIRKACTDSKKVYAVLHGDP